MEFWNQRTFCLVTGASRGIGKSVAIEFGKKVGPGSVFVLIARSEQGLSETKVEVQSSGASDIKVITSTLDLGKAVAMDYLNIIKTALTNSGALPGHFAHALLVHNAASPGNVTERATELNNLIELREYFELNVFSMSVLTSQFFAIFNETKERTVINITSMAGIIPVNNLSLYCIAKSAREMFVKCIAKEDSTISTINYAPGPVDTEMYWHMANNVTDPETAKLFNDTTNSGNFLTPIQTVTKLVEILAKRKFTKGEHVDYYDNQE